MSTRASVVAALVGLAACSAPVKAPHQRMTAKEIAEKSKPAIVLIHAQLPEGEALGTGFAIDAKGVIATNLHVVAGAREIEVRMLDGASYKVQRIVGIDASADLALLGISPRAPLPILPMGDSDLAEAGDPVVAIGNPVGLTYTVSDGLISSIRVDEKSGFKALQISAPISEGSSGGPLFNSFGEVIGLTEAIIIGGQNLNFAIPSNYLRQLVTNEQPLTLDEFARATAPPQADDVKIQRAVPNYDTTVLDGCSDEQAIQVGQAIQETIELGAPLYNQNTPEGISGCYKVYEGTSLEWQNKAACPGVRQAFKDGIDRANGMGTDKEKAWALRDTFDGLLKVIVDKVHAATP